MADESVSVALTADNKSFIKSFNEASNAIKNIVSAGQAMVKAFKYVSSQIQQAVASVTAGAKKMTLQIGAAFVGTALATRQAYNNFKDLSAAMANVGTVTDRTISSMGQLTKAVLSMSGRIPRTAEELAAGLYEVQSAGFQGAEALSVLENAAKFSVAGLTDMETSVRATTSIINAYGLSAEEAGHVTDVLFKAVEEGAMTASEFSMNIGDWSAGTAALGVSFESASAALAVMTTKGALRATAAATSLNGITRALIKPTNEMTAALKRMGFESGKAAIQELGLAGTLGALWEQAGRNETVFAGMIQDTEAFRGALGLVTEGYEELVSAESRFNTASETAGTTQEAFNIQMRAAGQTGRLLKNELREMGYNTGELVAPAFGLAAKGALQFVRAINDLPKPLRMIISGVSLATPALLTMAAIMGTFWLKGKLFGKAMQMMATSSTLAKLPLLQKFFIGLSGHSSILQMLTSRIHAFVKAEKAMRLAMIRSASSALATVAAWAALAAAAYLLVNAYRDAGKQADEFYSQFGDAAITTDAKKIESGLAAIREELDRTRYVVEGSWTQKLGRGLLAFGQVVTPFTSNKLLNDLESFEAGSEEEKEFLNQEESILRLAKANDAAVTAMKDQWKNGAISFQEYVDGAFDHIAGRLTRAISDGAIDGEAYFAAVAKANSLRRMVTDGDMTSEQLHKNGAWIASQKIISDTIIAYEDYIERVDEVEAAQNASSQSAADLELALIAIGDAASTTADRVDAMSQIFDNLLGNTAGLRGMQADMLENMERLAAAMLEQGANFDIATEGGRSLQDSMENAAESVSRLATETYRQTGSSSEAAEVVSAYVAGLISIAQNAGWSTDEIAMMLGIMNLTPETIETIINLPGIDPAISQLVATQSLLSGINGYVAQAGVNISVGVAVTPLTSALGIKPQGPVYAPGVSTIPNVSSIINGNINNMINSIIGNIPRGSSGGSSGGGGGGGGRSGGGGGGGGRSVWKPTAAQLKNMKIALAAPLTNLLEGELGDEWKKQQANIWFDAVTKNLFAEGKTRLGAGILKEAQKSGEDPSDALDDMVQAYKDLEKLVGKANADIALQQFDSLEKFQDYVSAIEDMVSRQQELEDWRYDRQELGYVEYKALLEKRLAVEEEFSSEWMSLKDQIERVEDDRLNEEKRMMEVRLRLQEIDKNQYLNYLYARLNGYKQYSEEWVVIWDEINDLEEESQSTLEDTLGSIKDFTDSVIDAFNDLKKTISDPILRATSLVSAFGSEASVSKDQVEGFYKHMLDGTQRWISSIKELKAKGVNQAFLNELIAAGPQSVGFAESILALGDEGIGFINQSMSEINTLANQFGSDLARAQVGSVIQNSNNVTLTVGDITIEGDGTLTISDVEQAVQNALHGVVNQVNNRHSKPVDPGLRPPPRGR